MGDAGRSRHRRAGALCCLTGRTTAPHATPCVPQQGSTTWDTEGWQQQPGPKQQNGRREVMTDGTFTLADYGWWRCADCAEYAEPQAGGVCDSCREEV